MTLILVEKKERKQPKHTEPKHIQFQELLCPITNHRNEAVTPAFFRGRASLSALS